MEILTDKERISIATVHGGDLMVSLNRDFTIAGFNEQFRIAFEEKNQQICAVGDNIFDYIGNEDVLISKVEVERIFEGASLSFSKLVRPKSDRIFQVTYTPYYQVGSQPVHVVILARDVSKTYIYEQILDGLYQNSRNAVIVAHSSADSLPKNFNCVFLNTAAEDLLNITRSDMVGKRLGDIFAEISDVGYEEICTLDTGKPVVLKLISGSFQVELSLHSGVAVVSFTLLQSKNAQLANTPAADIFHKLPYPMLVIEPAKNSEDILTDFIVRNANEEAMTVFYNTDGEIRGKSILHIVTTEATCHLLKELAELYKKGTGSEISAFIGNKKYRMAAVKVDSDLLVSFVEQPNVNIIHSELERKQELLLTTQSAAKLGSFEWNIPQDTLFWTPEHYRLWDLPEHYTPSCDLFLKKIHPEDKAYVTDLLREAIKGRKIIDGEFRLHHDDGRHTDIHLRASPSVENGIVTRLIGTVMDITDRKTAQREREYLMQLRQTKKKLEQSFEQLKRTSQEFRFVTDFIPQMVWSTSFDAKTDFYNDRWYQYTGVSLEQFSMTGWTKVVHPDDFTQTDSAWQFSVETGADFEAEFRLKKRDGTFRWFLGRAMPIKNDDGVIVKWFGTCTDIHEQKLVREELEQTQMDLRKINEELKRKNIDLDNFIYTASHDLKAPISNIEGLVNALVEECRESSQFALLSLINQSIVRFKNTIADLTEITSATGTKEHEENVDFDPLISEVIESLNESVRSSGVIISRDLKVQGIVFSRKNLRSILFNLISNAINTGLYIVLLQFISAPQLLIMLPFWKYQIMDWDSKNLRSQKCLECLKDFIAMFREPVSGYIS